MGRFIKIYLGHLDVAAVMVQAMFWGIHIFSRRQYDRADTISVTNIFGS